MILQAYCKWPKFLLVCVLVPCSASSTSTLTLTVMLFFDLVILPLNLPSLDVCGRQGRHRIACGGSLKATRSLHSLVSRLSLLNLQLSVLMCIASFEILLLRVTRHSPQGLTVLAHSLDQNYPGTIYCNQSTWVLVISQNLSILSSNSVVLDLLKVFQENKMHPPTWFPQNNRCPIIGPIWGN